MALDMNIESDESVLDEVMSEEEESEGEDLVQTEALRDTRRTAGR